ncbi:MAG TPA: response regulator [Candidatus Campbellbacteria bacterium]|nr:response regulator [Candidatus Campbellbacteria bacterium]
MQGILVIEDDKFFRDLVSKKLEKEGYEVWAASGSGEAFKLLEEKKPSLIILDLILPGLDGFEILSMIKKDKKTSAIPVIILSNLGQEEDIAKAKFLGVVDFMIKVNFTPGEIVEKVKKTLKNHYL